MSGLFGKGIYVQPTFQSNEGEETSVSDSNVLHGYNINHADLDYFDTEAITSILTR
jgi:hypothetical protein